jgi:xanthine dehydrogenase iron-sulfur cluster and FAD-binding subunit A
MTQPTNTHILVNEFTYHEPATLAEACELLLKHDARLMAGGTDVLVHMKMERAAAERGEPGHVVSLRTVPGLAGISTNEGGLVIGAMTTIAEIAADPLVRQHYLALAESCDAFSTRQVESMGTIGGNIGNASPAADTAPALLAFGAAVLIYGPQGERQLPIGDFFVGPGRSALRRGEIVTAIVLRRPAEEAGTPFRQSSGSAFLKMGRVAADIAKASAAVSIRRDGGWVVEARLAFGSVAPVPVRAPMAEALLAGKSFTAALAVEAAEMASREVSPIDDVRSEAWYRREIVRVMAHDGILRAWQRAGETKAAGSRAKVEGLNRGPETFDLQRAASKPTLPSLSLAPDQQRAVMLQVNGRPQRVWVGPNELLLNVLREKLQLTGSKYGCGIGECSACTVLMDGKPVLACLVLAVAAEGRDIRTVEGLQAADGTLDPLQEAFIDYAAFQCGYCTPGMLMTAKSLLAEVPQPSEDQVRHYLRGNLCRCTGYVSIVRAVLAAAGEKQPIP